MAVLLRFEAEKGWSDPRNSGATSRVSPYTLSTKGPFFSKGDFKEVGDSPRASSITLNVRGEAIL